MTKKKNVVVHKENKRKRKKWFTMKRLRTKMFAKRRNENSDLYSFPTY